MTKEVLIHLKGMQTTDDPHGSDEPLELITVGEYYYRNNTHYLLYEEQMEGLDEPIHNLVKIRPGHMEVRKKGPVHTIWSDPDGYHNDRSKFRGRRGTSGDKDRICPGDEWSESSGLSDAYPCNPEGQQRDYIFQSIIKIGPPDQLLIDMQCNKKRSLSSITGK